MASHLTITSSTAPTRAFGSQPASQQQGETGDALGIFAAMLGTAPAAPTSAEILPQANTLGQLGLEALADQAMADEDENTEALAVPIDHPYPVTAPVQPQAMVDFINALSGLKASLDRGETPDASLVERVETKLTELADALGIDLSTVEIPQDFAALLAQADSASTDLGKVLEKLLAPIAQSIASAQVNGEAASESDIAAASNLKLLNAKMSAFLRALEGGAATPEALTQAGMPPGQQMNAEIDAALERFAALNVPAVPAEPELSTPALKLTETALVGNSAETTESAVSVAKPDLQSSAKPDDRSDRSNEDAPQRDRVETRREPANGAAFAAPAANEAPSAETQPSASQPSNPRVDSASTSRVVIQAGYQTSQQQLNLPQIAFELGRQIEGGNTRFQIRLDPPELGRIDVRMEIDHSGNVNARLTVEKSETLDLMQRDQRGLERALQQAGIDAGKTNLEFSLKQNPFAGDGAMADNGRGRNNGESANDNSVTEETPEPTPTVNLYRGSLQASGINITV